MRRVTSRRQPSSLWVHCQRVAESPRTNLADTHIMNQGRLSAGSPRSPRTNHTDTHIVSASMDELAIESIIFVATESNNAEVRVSLGVLANVSTVWRERLTLAPPDLDDPGRSFEKATLLEVESFVGMCTLLSPNATMPELLNNRMLTCNNPRMCASTMAIHVLRRLAQSLTLIHKYDCPVSVARLKPTGPLLWPNRTPCLYILRFRITLRRRVSRRWSRS